MRISDCGLKEDEGRAFLYGLAPLREIISRKGKGAALIERQSAFRNPKSAIEKPSPANPFPRRRPRQPPKRLNSPG
jgi:hypothetical protein